MPYDLVIRNGEVIDGSGTPRRRADVAVTGDRIAAVGNVDERGVTEIDAEGRVVTPGFIDGHTHMDAQVAWDPLGTCSCWHGVTTVVMGNCGFTLAPARASERHLVVRNLERAEDISADAMAAGIDWTWETVPQYLDFVDGAPKGINYAAYVGHSALRTYAMGERAFTEEANEDDLAVMDRELRAGLAAGAIGLSTSRSFNHETSDDRPVASRIGTWDELAALVTTTGALGGMFEISNDGAARSRDPDKRNEYLGRLRALAVGTGAPVTFGILEIGEPESGWRPLLGLLDETAAAGGRMIGQAHCREFSVITSFRTRMPFDRLPFWSEVRSESLERQKELLSDPAVRQKLVDEAEHGDYGRSIGAETRKPDYDWTLLLDSPLPPHRTVAAVAAERGVSPVEVMIDAALATDMEQLFVQVVANHHPEHLLEIMRHPRTVMTFSDSGAHVSQIMDSSIHTHLLSHWVRDRQAFTLEEAVRMITAEPATAWGFADRGVVAEGNVADLNVLDPDTVAPAMPTVERDLPGGARRLKQKAVGIDATVVGGQVVIENGEHTGALPGRLLRRS